MKFARAIICFAILATSPLLLLQGLSNARIMPGPISWNGFWQAEVARAFLQVTENDGQFQIAVSERGSVLARDAYFSEPFATDALFVLAVGYRNEQRSDLEERVVILGLSLDKRNRQLGSFELEQAALAGDFKKIFATIDRLTLTDPRLVADLVQPLTVALEQEAGLPIISDALQSRPRWADAFWKSVPANTIGVTRLYELRQMTSAGSSLESDSLLLKALVREELYTEAFELWDTLGLTSDSGGTSFLQTTEFEPIGWRANSSGERSFSQLGDGEFEIFVEEQTYGELARQLVRIEAGRYRFAARVSPATNARNLEVQLACASDNEPTSEPQPLSGPAQWEVSSDCTIYWLILNGLAWDRRSALRASISEVSFERLSLP